MKKMINKEELLKSKEPTKVKKTKKVVVRRKRKYTAQVDKKKL